MTDERRCVSCMSSKTYLDEANSKRLWYHPSDNKKTWLCHPCYVRIYFRTYRKEHPTAYKSYQQAYHSTYNDSKTPKRKYQYHTKAETEKKLKASNRYMKRKLAEYQRQIAITDTQIVLNKPKTSGVM